MNAPLLLPLISLIAGILAAMAGVGIAAGGAAVVCGTLTYLGLRLLSGDPVRAYRVAAWQPLAIVLWFAGVGVMDYDLRRPFQSDGITAGSFHAAVGRVANIVNATSGDKLTIDVSQLLDHSGKKHDISNFRVIVQSDAASVTVDDIVVFPASFERITDNPDSFRRNYASSMAREGILYKCQATGGDIHLIGHTNTLSGTAFRIRNSIEGVIENSSLAKKTQNFLITILLGDRSYLDRDLRTSFADAGISHVLALSGMHIGIIASLFLAILFPINFFGLYKVRLIIVGFLIFGYAFISGFSYSTLRACVMCASMIMAVWLERKNPAWSALVLSMFIILTISPTAIFDIGLQLSVVCVASLIFFVTPLNLVDQHSHPRLYKINSMLICTMVATFGSWALTAYAFGSFPPVFMIANLVVLPALPLYLSLSLLHIAMISLGLDVSYISIVIDAGYHLLERFAASLNVFSGGSISLSVPWIVPVLWISGILTCATAMRCGRKRLYGISAAMGCVALAITLIYGTPENHYLICSKGRMAAINALSDGEEHRIEFPAGTLSVMEFAGKRVMALDCEISRFSPVEAERCTHLIIGRSFKGDLADLNGKIRPDTILIHPMNTMRREQKYKAESDSLGIPCISLRGNPVRLK